MAVSMAAKKALLKKVLSRQFTLYSADCRENPKNSAYNTQHKIRSEEDLKKAVASDYVCATYSGRRRSNQNFISSDCLAFDCDNTHSDKSEDWVTYEKLLELFPAVAMGIHFSRQVMRPRVLSFTYCFPAIPQ